MWPSLRPGYQIHFRFTDPETLSPGDILVLRGFGRRGERHVRVHRLLGRVGPYFVESGDNAYSAALVHANDILGRVELVRDAKGRSVKFPLAPNRLDRRFLLGAAHAFMFAHECKDRLVGQRRSLLLWRLSEAYRGALAVVGLKVPPIRPV